MVWAGGGGFADYLAAEPAPGGIGGRPGAGIWPQSLPPEESGGVRVREYVVECKVVRVGDGLESTVADGVEQTAGYMARCAAEAGHLVVIDQRENRSWDEKVFHRQHRSQDGVPVEVWGM